MWTSCSLWYAGSQRYLEKAIRVQTPGSSLTGVLEVLQEQNQVMQEQYKVQQQMLFDMIELTAGSTWNRNEGAKGKQEGWARRLGDKNCQSLCCRSWPWVTLLSNFRADCCTRMAKDNLDNTSSRVTQWKGNDHILSPHPGGRCRLWQSERRYIEEIWNQ